MKVEMLLEKVERLARVFPGLEIDGITVNNIEVVIDLDVENLKKVLREIPSGSCAGIVESGNRLTLQVRRKYERIGDVLFRASL